MITQRRSIYTQRKPCDLLQVTTLYKNTFEFLIIFICFYLFCRSVLPVWEELLLFNENFNYFTKADPKVIVLFEVSYSNIALRS